jgi:hypothetical protein
VLAGSPPASAGPVLASEPQAIGAVEFGLALTAPAAPHAAAEALTHSLSSAVL